MNGFVKGFVGRSGRGAVPLLSGVFDPSVSGRAASSPALYTRTSEYLPKSLSKLNEIVAPYGASFSNAWSFQAASGNEPDLAPSGGVALVPAGPPAQDVATALTDYVTDKAVQTTAGSGHRMAPAAATDLDVTTGDLVLLMTVRLPTAPAATQTIYSKCAAAYANYTFLQFNATGNLIWTVKDIGGNIAIRTGAVNHAGATYHDVLAVVDRSSASKLLSLTTSAEDIGTASLAAVVGSLSTATTASFGASAIGDVAAGAIITFAAWGTVVGSLVANRVAALAAYSSARAAGAQLWTKRGIADTAWSKVGP